MDFTFRIFIPTYRQSPPFWWASVVWLACVTLYVNAELRGWGDFAIGFPFIFAFALTLTALPQFYIEALLATRRKSRISVEACARASYDKWRAAELRKPLP